MLLLKRILRTLGFLALVLLAFAVGAIAVLTLTERGRENLAGLVSEIASSPGRTVSIGGLGGIWSGRLTMDSLAVSDAGGAWLVARGIVLDWSPLSLLSATFEADRMFAEQVELVRLPKDAAGEEASGGTLPVSLALRGIDLPHVALGPELSGGVAAVAAKGSAFVNASPLDVRTDLKIARTDGRAGSVDAALHFAPHQNVLDVNVSASEPSGGIIANLLRLPGEPAVDIELSGSGPAEDWSGHGSFAVDGKVVTTIEGRRRSTATGNAVEARGEGEFERFVPRAFRPLLQGRTVFNVAGSATGAGMVDIERAAIDSETVRVSASGIIDPQAASDFSLQLAAKGEAGVPLSFGSEESPIDMAVRSASLRAIGTGGEPKVDIEAALASVATKTARITDLAVALHSDAFNVETLTGPISGNAAAAAIVMDNPTAQNLVAGKVSVDLAGVLSEDTLTVATGRLSSDALSGTFGGSISLGDGSITLDMAADVASAALPPAVRGPLGERIAISGHVVRDAEGQVVAEPFSLSSAGLAAEGRIATTGSGIDASLEGRLADVGVLAEGFTGAVAISGTASGEPSSPEFSLAAESERIAAFGREISGARLTASGKADPANLAADIALAGNLAGEALSAIGSLTTAEGRPMIEGLQLALGPNRLSGDVRLGERFVPFGILEVELPEIAGLAGLAGETASGDLSGTVRLDTAEEKARAVVVVQSKSVRRGDVHAADAAVDATISDYLGRASVSGRIRAGSITAGSTVVSDVDVALDGDGQWTGFDGKARVGEIPATARGRLRIANGETTVELAAGQATVAGFGGRLASPSTIRIADGKASFDALTLDVDGATAVITGSAGSAWDLNATLTAPNEGMKLSLGTPESPIDLVLRSGSLRALGDREAPKVDAAASLSSVATRDARLESLDVALHSDAFDIASRTGPVTGNAAAAAVSLNNAALQPLVTGRLEASLAGTLGAEALEIANGSVASDAVTGRFNGNVSLATGQIVLTLNADLASSALPAPVRGVLAERSTIAGTLSRDAEGRITADEVSLQSGALAATGTALVDGGTLQASVTGSLGDVGLLSEAASGAAEFALEAAGSIGAPDLTLTVASDRIEAAGREITGLQLTASGRADRANPSGNLTLTGNVAGETLAGKASIEAAGGRPSINGLELTLGRNRLSGDLGIGERFLPSGTLALEMPEIAPVAALAGETASGDLKGTVRLETVESGPRIVVEAQSNSLVRGDVSAAGTTIAATIEDYLTAPTVSGRIRAATVTTGGTVIRDADVTLIREPGWTLFDGGATVTGVPARAKGRIRIEGGETTVELTEGEATVRGVKAIVAQPSTIRIAEGKVAFDALTLDVDGATAVVTGSAGSAWDLDATLTAPNEGMKLSLGTPESPIDIVLRSASLRALGDGGAPALDLAASLSSAATREARLESLDVALHSDAFDIASRTGPVTGNAAAAAVSLNNAALQPLITGRLEASLAGTLGAEALEIANGSVASDAVTGRFNGNVSLATGQIVLTLNADLASSALPAPVRGVLAERSTIAGTLSRDAEGRITADEVSLQSGALAATGTALVDGGTLQASVTGSLGDVGLLSEAASGAAEFALEAAGSIGAPDLTLTVASDRIEAAGREITGLQLTASGRADRANPSGNLTLTGNVAGETLAGKASIEAAGGRPSINGLELTLGRNRLSGDLGIGERFLPSGTLALEMPEIAPVAALAGETASGDLKGTVRLETVESGPRIVVEAQSNSLVRGDVSAAGTTIAATIEDYLTAPTVSGRIRAATVTTGGTVIRDADVTLSREPGWTLFDGGATVTGVPARAKGRIRIEGGETTVELTEGEATVRGVKAIVAQPSTIRIAEGKVAFDALTLDVDGATAVITGSAGSAWDLDATLTAPNEGMKLALGTPESPIDLVLRSGSLRALGDREAPKVDAAASLSSVATRDARLASVDISLQSEAFDIASRTGPVTGTAAAAALTLANASLQPLISGTIKATVAGMLGADTLQVTSGTIGSDAMDGRFRGSVSLATGAIRLDVDADVAASALPAPVRGVVAERASLSGALSRDAEGRVAAEGIELESGPLSATGSAALDGEKLRASVSGTIADVGLLSQGASGSVDFALDASGPAAAPDLSLAVSSNLIRAAGREITGLQLTAEGKADLDNPAAQVSLSGTVGGDKLEGSATLSSSGGTRSIEGLSLTLGRNRISGSLALDDDFLPLGTVNFALPDLGALAALALETAEGDLAGTISFADGGGKPQLSIDAKTSVIARGDMSARDLTINATVADYIASPAVSGRFRALSAASGTTTARDVDVRLTRDGAWTGFDGSATIADVPARAAGRFRVAGSRTTVELATARATVRGLQTALARPTAVVIDDGRATLDVLVLDLGGGTAAISGTAGSTLDLDARLAGVPASLANSFAPGLVAGGSISGTASVSGAASNPSVRYSIDWAGADTAQTRAAGLGAMRITSSGDFAGGRLTFDARAADGTGVGLRGGGTVDTRSRSLSVDVSGSVPFAFLTRRLAAQGLSLSGAADVSLQVRGTLASPAIGGSLRSSGARLVDSRSGIAIEDISADVSLGGGRATVRSLTGTLSTSGSLSASGTVGIEPARGFPADLSIRISDARYTDGRVVTATLNGNLAVRGPLGSAPTLSGTVDLGRTVITIPERLPVSLSRLGVEHRNAPAAVRQQQAALRPAEQAAGGAGRLTLNVTVNAANQIFVQGRGLDAELGGSLRLTGPTSAPQATGQFTLRRGRLSILGKRLTFTRGTIDFSGSLVPYLDLSADSTAGDTTVTVTVSGPANNPTFEFSSVPALPEDEILARLIFGRSMSNLSPLQIAQLAEAAAQFAGIGGSTTLLERLRSQIGVDDLDIRSDERGGTSVSVGKYLNDRTYLSLEKGDRAGSGKARIDLNVGRGVKLRGEASESGEAKGGIFFEREY